ncbi:MAG: hypothetical protein AAF591_12745, partial [Verrucomicrobiota bacterium]
GAEDNYEAHFNTQFKHNYNHVSRAQMYGFMNRHLGLGFEEPVLERDFEFLGREDLTVYDGSVVPRVEPEPEPGAHEREVCQWWSRYGVPRRTSLKGAGKMKKADFEVMRGGWEVIMGREMPEVDMLEGERLDGSDDEGYMELEFVVRNLEHGEEVSCVAIAPGTAATFAPENWGGKVVMWVHPEGKAGLYDADGTVRLEVLRLIDDGYTVLCADLFGGGGKEEEGEKAEEIREGQEWRAHSIYFYGYNDPLFVRRVHDLMAVAVFARENEPYPAKELVVAGVEGGGKWVAALGAMEGVMGEYADRMVMEVDGFRFRDLEDVWDADFVPGAVKYGDVEGLVTMLGGDEKEVWVSGVEGVDERDGDWVDWIVND